MGIVPINPGQNPTQDIDDSKDTSWALSMAAAIPSGIIKIFEGLLWVVIGILVLLLPIISLTAIMFFIAFWAIVIGIFQIIMSIRLRKVIKNEWLGILNGLFSFVFGILIMFNLLAGAEAIIMVFGIFAILFGISSIIISFRVKSIKAE